MPIRLISTFLSLFFAVSFAALAQNDLSARVDQQASALEEKVIAWRHYIHEHPELSNREFKTAEKVAEHLRSLGIDVQTEVAHTGVVGLLKGGLPGPVVALRADMDALPVTERVDIPWASEVTTEYNGEQVGVMHACGHDTHVAILMGVAELLSGMKDDLQGTVKFIWLDLDEAKGWEMLVMERLYPLDFRTYEYEARTLQVDVFAEELKQLHNAGFVRRELCRPSSEAGEIFDNIFLTERGIKLIDTGISALRDSVGEKLFAMYVAQEQKELEAFRQYYFFR